MFIITLRGFKGTMWIQMKCLIPQLFYSINITEQHFWVWKLGYKDASSFHRDYDSIEDMDLYTGKLENLGVIAKESMGKMLEYKQTSIWDIHKRRHVGPKFL